jgi:hypothetical protein
VRGVDLGQMLSKINVVDSGKTVDRVLTANFEVE